MDDGFIENVRNSPDEKPENADCSFYGFWSGLFRAFFSAISRCFDLKGRTSRFDCWGFFFSYVLLRIIVGFSLYYLENNLRSNAGDLALFRVLFAVAVTWLFITVMVRRLHDVNMRGWWILIFLVPFIVSFLKGNKEENRFGPAPVTNEKKALGAVLITFCPIVGLFLFVLSVGMIAGYTQATKKFEAVKTIDQIQQTVTAVQTLFSSTSKYEALDRPDLMYTFGVYDNQICGNAKCSHPVNPYGGPVSMKANEDGFTITYGGLPHDACVTLLTTVDWASALRKFRELSVNDEAFASPMQENAAAACKAGINTISWSVL